MRFAKYWARHAENTAICWGWSDASLSDAQARAETSARRTAAKLAAGQPLERYGYADRPLREEILREIKSPGGDVAALVTRNTYGCQVLNAARVMFVDVDLPEAKAAGAGGWLKSLFRKAPPPAADDHVGPVLAKAEAWARQNAGWGWRVYRTKAGLRLLATHALFDPVSPAAESVFAALDADPLYARLCRVQECFRARLTPKPWRCGAANPPAGWPWLNTRQENAYRQWERSYLKAAAGHATCALVATIGNSAIHPEIQPIVTLHDDATRVGATLPLA